MTPDQALSQARALGVARLDAQMLLLHLLGRARHDRAWLLAHASMEIPAALAAPWHTLLTRRAGGEPLAYLVGRKAFYGLDLQVDARVLDPRADTETLVDWALEVLRDQPQARVLDLGTGSGAIALALKNSRSGLQVHALDASAEALQVAQANARALGLSVQWHEGDWLQGLDRRLVFDAIVSNPPYIAAHDPHLDALRHEPLRALASGVDGLDDLRAIISQAAAHLRAQGWLLLEHGHEQADAVCALLHTHGFQSVQSRRDLAGTLRCSGGQRL